MKKQYLLIFALLATTTACFAQTITNAGWYNLTGQLQPTEGTDEEPIMVMESNPLAARGELAIAETITPEIEALARGLENDPVRIFNYVHDHIRHVLYFGAKKGAQLTLLERSGNDFDQCALLVALLRSAGYSPTYQFGLQKMPYESLDHQDIRSWLGLGLANTNYSTTLDFLGGILQNRGYPIYYWFADGSSFAFHRVWVNLVIGATTYYLDPAFKTSEAIVGIDLPSAMGLNTNDLWNAAAGTNTADYVQNLNDSALRNKLRDYTTNLLTYLQSNYPNASVEQISGGRQIILSTNDVLRQSLLFPLYTDGGQLPVADWDNEPVNLMSSLTIGFSGTNYQWYIPSLQGQRLSLTFSSNGVVQLWQEDALLLQRTNSGSGRLVDVSLSVDHPHGEWGVSSNALINSGFHDQSVTTTYQRTNATYALLYAFDASTEELRARQLKLDVYRQQGLSDTSRQVMSETLNIMGLSWMLQGELSKRSGGNQFGIQFANHHRLGRMGMEHNHGYYLDVNMEVSSSNTEVGSDSANQLRAQKFFEINSYLQSALEHGVIEQTESSNQVAASTVKMLLLSATNTTQKVFLATSNNWTTGSNVRTQLLNYDLTYLDSYISAGFSLLLPRNGSIQLAGSGSWSGYGFVARFAQSNQFGTTWQMSMLIDGIYGSYSADPDSEPQPAYVWKLNSSDPNYFEGLLPVSSAADPVDMSTGAFIVNERDLVLGGPEPRGFSFVRHYSPTRRHHNLSGMAAGWVNNYHCNLAGVSAPEAALGNTTPAQMASMLVAMRALSEFYNTQSNPKNWLVTALIAKWGVDQLIDNGVSITLGKDTIQFIKQPNGAYTAPAGSTMSLTNTGTAYNLLERHGKTFKFNASGRLTNIVDQYNQGLTLTYNSSNWVSTVKDWKNRQLTFTYSGTPSRLASVADGTRTVLYGYTTNAGQLDLTSVTDPESKTRTFLYDTNHQIVSVKNALNQLVVSNIYDGFGRVVTQYTQGDTNKTWQLYWSGYVNTEQNPAGSKRRFLYDDKSREIGGQDALGNTNRTFYDAQDHVVMTTSPMNETNRFEFDGRHNLLRTIDPLNFTNQFIYDAQDNLVRMVDARGNTNSFGYNTNFSLAGITNGAGDFVNYSFNTDGTLASRTDSGGTNTYGYDSTYKQLISITYPGSLGSEGFLNNSFGDVLSHTNARGFVTSFQYSLRRELTNTIAPTNLTAKLSFDAVGNLSSMTDARTNSTTNAWSATRKLLSTTFPATPQGTPSVTNTYDNRDWLSRTANPLQQATLYTNDATGRQISMTDPLLRTTRFGYDAVGRKLATTNAAIEVTRQTWNERSELIQVIDPSTNMIKRAYDATGNQVTLTNRNGKKWQFKFDAANRLTNSITPLNRTNSQTYNNRGLLASLKEPSGDSATLTYDAKGRLTNSADAVASKLFRYDPNNNVTNIIEAGKTNAWTFDAYDQVSTYKDADGNLIQYRYDQNHNLTNLVYPGGKTVTYFYDSLNRLTNVTDWANRKTSMEYDLASRVKKITRPNGTVREMNYDVAGQATNIIERTAASVPIAFFKFNWNNAARMEWEFVAPLQHAYTPPTRTMTYDDDNRIATFNGNSVTNDSDGNMTSGPLTNSTFASYTFDARNRLTSTFVSSVTNIYGYDALNNRTSITNGTNITKFVINPNAALSQTLIRVKNGVTNYYVYGMGLLYEADDSGNTKTYHYDYRGSTVALTDGSGIVTDRIEYSVYGMTTYRVGTTDTPFLFNGRYGVQTDVNGLLHMRARFYNPFLCRFLNADPSGFAGGLNFYAYADGNPISLIDPFGLWSWDQTLGVVRTAGGGFEAAAGITLGAATSWTGVGALAGGAVAVHGIDQIQAGIRQAWNGGHVDSVTSSGLQVAGMSQTAANWTDAGISVVGSFGAGLATTAIRAQTVISAEAANANVLQQAAYYEIGQKTVSNNANSFYSLWANPIDRGAAIVADQGWLAATWPQGSGFILGIGKTFTTGPTPLGLFGVSALGAGANAVGK